MATISFKGPRTAGINAEMILFCAAPRRQSPTCILTLESSVRMLLNPKHRGKQGLGREALFSAEPYLRPAGPLGVALGAASALAAAACALSATEISPKSLRTSVSILVAMSLLAFRN